MKNLSANELRIGNLVHFIFTNETVEIVGINAHESNNKSIYNTISFRSFNLYCESFETIKPIPLTEDWLLKFGFDNKHNKDKFTIITKGKLNYEKGRTYFNSWTILEKQPDYVHELQNLYFALTGTELTLIK